MPRHIELNPVSHFTIGTVGQPGDRTFYLQGGHAEDLVTLVIEKVQASALADSFESLLGELVKRYPTLLSSADETAILDLTLHEPVTALFRVGNLGLGYNEDEERVVLVAYEMVPDDEEPNVVSFWASVQQIVALIAHARDIVQGGRPICGNCGQPMDATGHFCAHRNGYIQ